MHEAPLETMKDALHQVTTILKGARLPLSDEKMLQEAIAARFLSGGINARREHRMDCGIPDFTVATEEGLLVVEVKTKASPRSIWRQIERYAADDLVGGVLLVTGTTFDIPGEVNNKPCRGFALGRAWL